MKTKNNVQKTILRFAAVVISFVLISFTVSAQDFWKKLITGSGFNEIALAMVDHTGYENNDEVNFTGFELMQIEEKEEELKLESWMMDERIFGKYVLEDSKEIEEPLKLEPWMFNKELFSLKESEVRLKLESWMTDKSVWR